MRFVVAGQVMPVGIQVRSGILWTDAAIGQRVANSGPRFRFGRWHKAPSSGGRRAVGHAFESVYAVPLESTDLPRACLHHRSLVRGNDPAVSARERGRLRIGRGNGCRRRQKVPRCERRSGDSCARRCHASQQGASPTRERNSGIFAYRGMRSLLDLSSWFVLLSHGLILPFKN